MSSDNYSQAVTSSVKPESKLQHNIVIFKYQEAKCFRKSSQLKQVITSSDCPILQRIQSSLQPALVQVLIWWHAYTFAACHAPALYFYISLSTMYQ